MQHKRLIENFSNLSSIFIFVHVCLGFLVLQHTTSVEVNHEKKWEIYLYGGKSGQADHSPCHNKDDKADKEREYKENIQQTSHDFHKGLTSLEHEDGANKKANGSIVDEDELRVEDVKLHGFHEFSEEESIVDNGSDGQTKSITAKHPGCQSTDVLADQENQESNHHEGHREAKVCNTECHKCCHRLIKTGITT